MGLSRFTSLSLLLCSAFSCIQPNLPDQCLPAGNNQLMVANGLAASLSSVDLDDNGVCEFVVNTGPSPNDFQVSDTALWLVTSGDNRLTAWDRDTFAVSKQIHLGDNANPWFFRIDPVDPRRGFVTQWLGHRLDVVDLVAAEVTDSVPMQEGDARPHPQGLAVSEDLVITTLTHFRAAAPFGTGEVAVFHRETLASITRFDTCTNPTSALILDDRSELHVLCSGVVAEGVSDDGQAAIYSLNDWSLLRTVKLGASPSRAIRSQDGAWIYAAAIEAIVGYPVEPSEPPFTSAHPLLSSEASLPFISGVIEDPTASSPRLIGFDFANSEAVWVSPDAPGKVLRRVTLGLGAQFGIIMTL